MKPLSIDWLQINAGGGSIIPPFYSVKKLDFQTRQFAKVEEISDSKGLICTIASKPHSSIIPKDTHLVKFDNKWLYTGDTFKKAQLVLLNLRLKIKGISRLDIALDLNEFVNNLKPQNLIKGIMNNKYLKVGRGKYKLIGTQDYEHEFETIRYGSNTSNVAVYLYNKSKELREVKMKHYIVEKWCLDGLSFAKDIWRLEVSIKCNKIHTINTQTGEATHLTFDNCLNDNFITNLYYTALASYFRFKINDYKRNKSRMSDVKLLSEINYDSKLMYITDKQDNTRADRIFIKKMEEYNNELRERNFELSTFNQEVISDFVNTRGLKDYYNKIAG